MTDNDRDILYNNEQDNKDIEDIADTMISEDEIDVCKIVVLQGLADKSENKHIVVIIKMNTYLKLDGKIEEYAGEIFINVRCPENPHRKRMQFSIENPEALDDFVRNAKTEAIYGDCDIELVIEFTADRGLRPCDFIRQIAENIFF